MLLFSGTMMGRIKNSNSNIKKSYSDSLISIQGRVLFKGKKLTPATGAKIYLLNSKQQLLDSLILDTKGRYTFRTNYFKDGFFISVKGCSDAISIHERCNYNLLLKGKVIFLKSGLPIMGMKFALLENSKITFETRSDKSGSFYFDYLPFDHIALRTELESDLVLSPENRKFAVYFPESTEVISENSKTTIERVAGILESDKTLKVEICSYTQDLKLAAQRSKSISNALKNKGIKSQRIKIKEFTTPCADQNAVITIIK